MSTDTRAASADGCEMTFAVNCLAHSANIWRRLLGMPEGEVAGPGPDR